MLVQKTISSCSLGMFVSKNHFNAILFILNVAQPRFYIWTVHIFNNNTLAYMFVESIKQKRNYPTR